MRFLGLVPISGGALGDPPIEGATVHQKILEVARSRV